MNTPVKQVLILGGGSAGWLAAGVLAAEHGRSVGITLVESPDVPTVGVGEGTWPTMRDTLRRMGVSERAFMQHCDASFKQGTKFVGWQQGRAEEFYYHPFSLPQGYFEVDSVPCWQGRAAEISFARAVTPQEQVCQQHLAPKQVGTPEFAAVLNYAYHLDAAKFGLFLRDHCVTNLGVRHVSDRVTGVTSNEYGDIASVVTLGNGELAADLFIDCSGSAGVLIGDHLGRRWIDRGNQLFNDSALAVQVPYRNPQDPIASATLSTALKSGWVWDIGLPTRRGVGYVYSSAHTTHDAAEAELREYLGNTLDKATAAKLEVRQLRFEPGHLEAFWHRNCVAVGMSSGFIEPLEASALALVELSAAMIRDDFPANRSVMNIVAQRFNERFRYRWDRIIDFLKLHYVLSGRDDTDYWRDHRDPATQPERLRDLLEMWRHRTPSRLDFYQVDEIFPAASYLYVLYGMGFRTRYERDLRPKECETAVLPHFQENARQTKKMLAGLPANRELLMQLAETA